MVFILDDGSEFDAPLEKVWRYLPSDDHRHPSAKVLSREITGNVVVLTSERTVMGNLVRVKIRNTLYPPIGFLQEFLEGPAAGSRAFVYYTPKSDKTGITIVGDYKISGLDEKATKDLMMSQLQTSFDEDNANLKNAK